MQDCTKLILTLKPPADDAMYARARADIEAAGGTIKYEYHEALKGMAICVPKDELETLKNKDYVDAIESDGEGKLEDVIEWVKYSAPHNKPQCTSPR